MKRIGTIATAGALIGLIASSAGLAQQAMPAGSKKAVSPVLAGDDKLTCPQILAETRARQQEFDAALNEADNAKVKMSARTAGLLAAHEALASAAPLMTPDVNPGAMAAVGASTAAYMESGHADARKVMKPIEQRADFAAERSDYLNDLYRSKCLKKGTKGPAPTTAMHAPDGGAPVGPASAPPAATPTSTAPTASAPAGPPTSSAAASGNSVDRMDCAALKAEGDRLRKLMDGQNAAVMKMAQSYKPGQASAPVRAASKVANLATALIPAGLGGALSAAASAATSAAQKAEHQALYASLQGQADQMMTLGMRISEIETAYEEKCPG